MLTHRIIKIADIDSPSFVKFHVHTIDPKKADEEYLSVEPFYINKPLARKSMLHVYDSTVIFITENKVFRSSTSATTCFEYASLEDFLKYSHIRKEWLVPPIE